MKPPHLPPDPHDDEPPEGALAWVLLAVFLLFLAGIVSLALHTLARLFS